MPDFLVIGAQRCGTTSFFRYLRHQPYFVLPGIKEIHYFDLNYHRGPKWYLSHFPTKIKRKIFQHLFHIRFLTGEASPYYLFHPLVPERIANDLPKTKFIILLRNPIDRAFSQYQKNLRNKIEKFSFERAIAEEQQRISGETYKLIVNPDYQSYEFRVHSYLSRGIYIKQIKLWHAYFDKSRFLYLISEEFFSNPFSTLNKVFQFLEIPNNPIKKDVHVATHTYEIMNPETRKKLIEFYKPYNEELYEYLRLKVNWDW